MSTVAGSMELPGVYNGVTDAQSALADVVAAVEKMIDQNSADEAKYVAAPEWGCMCDWS